MLICENCGRLCDENEVTYSSDYRGECHGVECYERVSDGCPSCGGDLTEAIECKICGEHHSPNNEECAFGYCRECLDAKATLEAAWDIGADNKESVKLNGFITSAFSVSEIEDILYNFIKSNPEEMSKAKSYCLDDIFCFTDYLDEKCK